MRFRKFVDLNKYISRDSIRIHSDDTGASNEISLKHGELWLEGHCKSFSLLAKPENLIEFVNLLRANPNRDITISCHLNLVEGTATSKDSNLLINSKGQFRLTFIRIAIQCLHPSKRKRLLFFKEIENEWRKQIQIIRKAISPREIFELDSHMHVHLIPPLWDIAKLLGNEFGITRIRKPIEPIYAEKLEDIFSFKWLKGFIKNIVIRICAFKNQPTQENNFIGIIYSGNMQSDKAMSGLQRLVQKRLAKGNKTNSQITVLFHPGQNSQNSEFWDRKFLDNWYKDPAREMEMIELKKFSNQLDECIKTC